MLIHTIAMFPDTVLQEQAHGTPRPKQTPQQRLKLLDARSCTKGTSAEAFVAALYLCVGESTITAGKWRTAKDNLARGRKG